MHLQWAVMCESAEQNEQGQTTLVNVGKAIERIPSLGIIALPFLVVISVRYELEELDKKHEAALQMFSPDGKACGDRAVQVIPTPAADVTDVPAWRDGGIRPTPRARHPSLRGDSPLIRADRAPVGVPRARD